MVMADFSGSEAEELRRALSFHRSPERMEKVCRKMRSGMERKNVPASSIEQVVKAVQSFAQYGFPESHAISFALLAYASAWLKVHRTPEFFAGLLNNQPMGFYSPATLVRDARRHGVKMRAVSVLESDWPCTVGADDSVRLGLCYARGLSHDDGERIASERRREPFVSLADFQMRTQLPKAALRTLAKIGALNGLAAHRREAQWHVELPRPPDDLLSRADSAGEPAPLGPMAPLERLQADYSGTDLTLGPHPMALIRDRLPGVRRAADLASLPGGRRVRIAGMVICRQRPGTAKGFVFISLEDETGISNAIVPPQLFERARLRITEEPFLIIEGVLQNTDNVVHVKARSISPLRFDELAVPASHDFH
jgi:error-prone DNA polymerase